MDALGEFEAHRGLLFALAYRMLGSVADAEDVLQDAYLRYEAVPIDTIRAPKAFLSTLVTRLCLNQLESARARRETYVGPWLPEPVRTDRPEPAPAVPLPSQRLEMLESISMAFLVLLEQLTPAERAVLVLREGLGYSHADVATAVGITEASSRQLLTRARRRLPGGPVRQEADPAEHRRLLEALVAAFASGDTVTLVDLLRADVTVVTDGGGEVKAALRPVIGRDKVIRLLTSLWPTIPPGTELTVEELNGLPGVVARLDGQPLYSLCLDVQEARVARLLIVSAPAKLRRLTPADPTNPGLPG